jgi:hypothetical protein
VIDILAALPDQDVRAGDLAGRDLVLEELGDLLKLGLIEMRPGRYIECAFGAAGGVAVSISAPQASAPAIDVNSLEPPSGIRRGV